MGTKLAWTGLALTVVSPLFGLGLVFTIAGAIILVIGVALMWFDK